MGKKKLRKQIKALSEALDSHVASLVNVRNENELLTEKQYRLQLNIKMIEEKLRFALVNAKAPPGKSFKWGMESEPCSTMPMGAQEKLGCVPVETTAVELRSVPELAP